MLTPEELLDIGLAAKTAEWCKAHPEPRSPDEETARALTYAQAAGKLDRTLQAYRHVCQQFVAVHEQLQKLIEVMETREKTIIQEPPFERTN